MRIGFHLRIALTSLRIAALEDLQYRTQFIAALIDSLFAAGMSLAAISIVYRSTSELNGWSADQIIVSLGVFFILGSFVMGIIHSSAAQMADDVKSGTFDFRLLKPVDSQVISSIQKVRMWYTIDLIMGLALVGFGLTRDGAVDAGLAGELALAAGLLLVGVVLMGAFWTLVSCLCFWTIQGQGIIWALDDMYDHVRWPLGIFPGPLRIALSTIFPAGLAITVPAEALLGRLTIESLGALLGMAVLMLVCSRIAWRHAISHYASASS